MMILLYILCIMCCKETLVGSDHPMTILLYIYCVLCVVRKHLWERSSNDDSPIYTVYYVL
jgi:hypothetical protein